MNGSKSAVLTVGRSKWGSRGLALSRGLGLGSGPSGPGDLGQIVQGFWGSINNNSAAQVLSSVASVYVNGQYTPDTILVARHYMAFYRGSYPSAASAIAMLDLLRTASTAQVNAAIQEVISGTVSNSNTP
jgi:hypothetical protein